MSPLNDGGVAAGSVALGPELTAEVMKTAGKSLVNSHWGSYVLFLKLPVARSVIVLRGPMSALPCFWIRFHNITVLFSLIEDCLALKLLSFSVDWDCIRAQAAGGDYLTRQTAINEIQTLVSGECLEIGSDRISRKLYWDPSSIRTETPVGRIDDAAVLLRNTTQHCVNAWVATRKTILLQLSGGLDSSILLACMCRAPTKPETISVNFWSKGSGDERNFARSMTDITGTELLECERDQEVDLRRFLNCARTGNPVVNFSAYDIEPRLVQLAHQRSATAIFNGEIGDDIFGHSPAPEVLAECLNSCWPSMDFFRSAADYAELARVSLWSAVSQAIRYRSWQRQTPYWSLYRYKQFLQISTEKRLVTDDVARSYEQMLTRYIHPWFENVRCMPLGRVMLLWGLVNATSTWSHSPFAGADSGLFMSPLASQPLVEAFCSIPSRLHFLGAENGAVARRAFRAYLTDAILSRGTGKGSPDMWMKDVLLRNRVFLRELLLDGILVRERILDKSRLEAALSGAVSNSRVGLAELVIQLYIESWLRRWTTSEASVAV